MPNRLAGSTSPYLLQHQHNPVDWYPWGNEALNKASQEDKPIFLSIGYSACHWCHVMEHESFENVHIAAILNEHFVSIKVDREQRPDLDQIYMQVVQMLTGSGGWPMSVFLTPTTKPFYGGTYWPPENRWGRPGFANVLLSVSDAWKSKRQAILDQSEELVGHLQKSIGASASSENTALTKSSATAILKQADAMLLDNVDPNYGGFGSAPKFPHAMNLRFLMRLQSTDSDARRLKAITKSLDCMANGGIYDHLGGGFARYSVDERWLVPHFEKMLYDNALLVSAYLDGYCLTKNTNYANVARETLDYVLRDMTDPMGGFYSAEDADSEGEEGKFYVWSHAEVLDLLGVKAGKLFCEAYGVTQSGNFEGHNILYVPQSYAELSERLEIPEAELRIQLCQSRQKLFEARTPRVRPLRDDKVLISWNALMISAMAEAGVVLSEPRYLNAAQRCADFLLNNLKNSDGNWLHVWRDGRAEITAFLDDYSCLAVALIQLWECDQDSRWLSEAIELVDTIIRLFSDPNGNGFFFTAEDAEELITRVKDSQDGSVPSGNSMAAWALLRLAQWTGREDYRGLSYAVMESSLDLANRSPLAAGQWLMNIDEAMGRDATWIILFRETMFESHALRAKLKSIFKPEAKQMVVPVGQDGRPKGQIHPAIQSWLNYRMLEEGNDIALFLCEGSTCQQPIFGLENIISQLTRCD